MPTSSQTASRVRQLTILGLACGAWLLAAARSHAEQELTFKRWAIVAAKDVQATGLSDLLTARLTQVEGLELVEREQLAAVTSELELSALFAAGAANRRLQLGRLVQADVLLILSLERRDEQQVLRLILSETTFGARLHVDSFAFDPDRLEESAARCHSSIQQTRVRFREGVKHLVGVTQLLSKNLTHDFDHLQSGYAALLEAALTTYPGVAVVEIEEARAISRELQIGGGELKAKVAPVFVEGEFTIAKNDRPEAPTVDLKLQIRDAKGVRQSWRRDGVAMDDVPELLVSSLAGQIVKLSADQRVAPLSRRQQQRLLAARAGAFAQLGLWRQSTALREAALLLDPDDVESRMALIVDYLHWLRKLKPMYEARFAHKSGRADDAADRLAEFQTAIAQVDEQRLAYFRLLGSHCNLLIARRQLNLRESALVVLGACYSLLEMDIPSLDGEAEIKQSVETFFWNAAQQFPSLDNKLRDGRLHPALRRALTFQRQSGLRMLAGRAQEERWSEAKQIHWFAILAGNFICSDLARSRTWEWRRTFFQPKSGFDDRRTLDRFDRLITQVVPTVTPLSLMSRKTLAPVGASFPGMVQQGRLNADEVRTFYQRLEKSGQPLNVFYARCGLLALEAYVDKQVDREALAEADALIQWIESDPFRKSDSGKESFLTFLIPLRAQIARSLNINVAKSHKLPANPIPPYDPKPRVRFAPLDDLPGDALELTKCSETLDMIRALDAVYVIFEQGVVRRIFENATVHAAAWDGENIWIVTAADGVHIISPRGRVLGRIDAKHGLPPYESARTPPQFAHFHKSPVWLHAVEPGRCIAVGALAGSRRLWFAEFSRDEDGEFRSRIFHTATKTPDDQSGRGRDDDPERVFRPQYLLRYTTLSPERDWLLVGRDASMATGRRPLVIDLKTLAVSVLPVAIVHSNRSRHAVDRGRIVSTHGFGITAISPPADGGNGWKAEEIEPSELHQQYQPSGCLLPYNGALINGGAVWRRLDQDTLQPETLTPTPLPIQYHFERYALSAHYGLVAWNQGDSFYRASIDGDPPTEGSLAEKYPFLPEASRQRHQQAVDEIRRLGGSVDVEFGQRIATSKQLTRRDWGTVVYLSEDWQGGDAGLAHLADLRSLRTVQLVRADVTDAGLVHIGRLATLERLEIVETSVTNKGLAELLNLKRLSRLRLEGPLGGEKFSDHALKTVSGLPSLWILELYGRGFTDKGLGHLQQASQMESLSLFDTAMTKEALNRFKQSRAGFQWREHAVTGIVRKPEDKDPQPPEKSGDAQSTPASRIRERGDNS
ncbi:MAG: CsgG/HfaB family protein [Pirellulaceae bacterium]